MTFTSFEFLLYFPVAVLLYNIVPQRFRVWYLLVVSYAFYAMMQPVYLVLLAGVTGMTYGFARWIAKTDDDKKRSRIMVYSIICILLPLFFFKYYNFVNEQIAALIGVEVLMPKMGWMLPVGISFYTFMAIGYLVDVNNEEVEVEKNIGNISLFLSFFPYILAGPIERAGNMLPQIKSLKKTNADDLRKGLRLMLWGYFMKLCVADRITKQVDVIFSGISYYNGNTILLGSFLYPIQLYADFAGYSLIAMGVAQCMGIRIMQNFNRPFFSTSMSEFWRRWHISLIKWLTDYVYTPLNFSLRKWKTIGILVSIMITFFISGVWHGASVAFIVWGVIQGVYLCVDALIQKQRSSIETKYNLRKKWWYVVPCCIIVFVLFAFSQIYGRCQTIDEANFAIFKIFTERGIPSFDKFTMLFSVMMLIIMFAKELKDELNINIYLVSSNKSFIRVISVVFLIVCIILFGVLNEGQFIYFKF